eukprot:733512_1
MKVSGSSLIVALCIGSVQAFAPSSISRTSTQLQFGIPTFGAGKDKEEKASKNDIDSLPEPKIGMSGLVQLITAGMGAAFLGDFEGVEEDTGKMMFSLEANNLVDENGNSKQTSMPYFESGWVDEDEEKGKKESKGGFKLW